MTSTRLTTRFVEADQIDQTGLVTDQTIKVIGSSRDLMTQIGQFWKVNSLTTGLSVLTSCWPNFVMADRELLVISCLGMLRRMNGRLRYGHRRARENSAQSVLALPLVLALHCTVTSAPLRRKIGPQPCLNLLAGQMPQRDQSNDKQKRQSR